MSAFINKEEDKIKNIIDFDDQIKLSLNAFNNITQIIVSIINTNIEITNKYQLISEVLIDESLSDHKKNILIHQIIGIPYNKNDTTNLVKSKTQNDKEEGDDEHEKEENNLKNKDDVEEEEEEDVKKDSEEKINNSIQEKSDKEVEYNVEEENDEDEENVNKDKEAIKLNNTLQNLIKAPTINLAYENGKIVNKPIFINNFSKNVFNEGLNNRKVIVHPITLHRPITIHNEKNDIKDNNCLEKKLLNDNSLNSISIDSNNNSTINSIVNSTNQISNDNSQTNLTNMTNFLQLN